MHSGSSLGEVFFVLRSLFENYIDIAPSSSNISVLLIPSATSSNRNKAQDQSSLITPPPELHPRSPVPEPQNGNDCSSQASRSASQAIQQASQQASESIRQASQSASQAAQQASQSASQGIQQAQNDASQSIAAASRSISSVSSSASSAIASVQSSANQAISRASGSMMSAQSQASGAVLQAGAAVAAATGSAAAAGSSFLAAAAKATQGAQASLSAIGATASEQAAGSAQQVSVSQTVAVTATQAALAIVGSIIASTLITILIYFLVIRHKKLVRRRSNYEQSPRSTKDGYPSSPKFLVSDQVGFKATVSQSNYEEAKTHHKSSSSISLSMFPATPTSAVKTTSVPWNPSNPPKAPTLTSFLNVHEGVSPFGSIKLPMDERTDTPLGGQLKSPHRDKNMRKPPMFSSDLPLRNPRIPVVTAAKLLTVTAIQRNPSTWKTS